MNSTPDGLAMTERPKRPVQAYRNPGFLNSKDARELRILAEYLEPKSRFDYHKVDDTIVFMGSARLKSREAAEEALRAAEAAGAGVEAARMALKMSIYYEAARSLAFRLTNWSKELDRKERRFVVCTGGGPGIMEAAHRGARAPSTRATSSWCPAQPRSTKGTPGSSCSSPSTPSGSRARRSRPANPP